MSQRTELKEESELSFLGWAKIGEDPQVPPFTQSHGSAPEAPGLGQVDQYPVAHYDSLRLCCLEERIHCKLDRLLD